jgi:hypothetical protein
MHKQYDWYVPADEMLRKALTEQEGELQRLDKRLADLRPLQIQRDNIFHLVAQMRFNLGMEPYRPPEEPQETPTENSVERRPIWEAARSVLEKSGVPMSTGEIAQVLIGLGYDTLAGRSGKETVRALLNKKKGIFRKLQDGRFELHNGSA